MTLAQWKKSKWGLPGSSGRYCEDDCHCILVPVEMIPELPTIGDRVKLRGDDNTDVPKVVDLHPRELSLKELMDKWNEKYGKLPPEIYDMPVESIEAYLRELMKKKG